MLLTPQHRRSARVAARMQKTAQQEFNERVANGTMTKEELLNAPTCFRSFDEAEDAILAQSDEESEEESDEEDSCSSTCACKYCDKKDPTYWRYNSDGEYEYRSDWSEDDASPPQRQVQEEEDEPSRKMRLFLNGRVLTEDPLLLKLIVSRLPTPLVSAIIQQLIKELEEAQEEEAQEKEEEEKEEEEEEEEEEDSIASRLLKRRRMERGQHY